MRKGLKIGVLLGILILGGVILGVNGEKIINIFGFQYLNERELYTAGHFKVELLPANARVIGYIEGELFSVYVLDKANLENFKKGKDFNPIYSWENVSYVELDFHTTENLYIVVRNELAKKQWIHIKLNARR